MKLAVNGRFLGTRVTGVQRVARQLVDVDEPLLAPALLEPQVEPGAPAGLRRRCADRRDWLRAGDQIHHLIDKNGHKDDQDGRLEDERPFNSVRRLVQYEDHMLRLLRDAGVPTAAPLGIVEIRQVFKISRVGTVAGCYVIEGKIRRNDDIRVIRDGRTGFAYAGTLQEAAGDDSVDRFAQGREDAAGGEHGEAQQNYWHPAKTIRQRAQRNLQHGLGQAVSAHRNADQGRGCTR